MILCLHHIDLIIPKGSENEARQCYCETLGFKEIQKLEVLGSTGLWVQLHTNQMYVRREACS